MPDEKKHPPPAQVPARPGSADAGVKGTHRRTRPRSPVSLAERAGLALKSGDRETYLLLGTPPGGHAVDVVVRKVPEGYWVARAWILPRGGIPVIGKIEIGFVDRDGQRTNEIPASGVTARLLRALPLGRVFQAARAQIDEALWLVEKALEEVEPGTSARELVTQGYAPRERRRRDTRGRKPLPLEELAEIARDYADLVATGSTSPNLELARRRNVSRKWIEELVRRARSERLLSASKERGRAGGVLTARARKILSNKADKIPSRRKR